MAEIYEAMSKGGQAEGCVVCGDKVKARTLCTKHYFQLRRAE